MTVISSLESLDLILQRVTNTSSSIESHKHLISPIIHQRTTLIIFPLISNPTHLSQQQQTALLFQFPEFQYTCELPHFQRAYQILAYIKEIAYGLSIYNISFEVSSALHTNTPATILSPARSNASIKDNLRSLQISLPYPPKQQGTNRSIIYSPPNHIHKRLDQN